MNEQEFKDYFNAALYRQLVLDNGNATYGRWKSSWIRAQTKADLVYEHESIRGIYPEYTWKYEVCQSAIQGFPEYLLFSEMAANTFALNFANVFMERTNLNNYFLIGNEIDITIYPMEQQQELSLFSLGVVIKAYFPKDADGNELFLVNNPSIPEVPQVTSAVNESGYTVVPRPKFKSPYSRELEFYDE